MNTHSSLRRLVQLCALISFFGAGVTAQTFRDDFETLDQSRWTQVDRGELSAQAGVLNLNGCYVFAGDSSWGNYAMEFKARAPETASEVRIFAGFRYNDDKSRYVFGLRGGNNNDLFLARLGADNDSLLLAIEPLDFIPQKGEWYTVKIQIEESSIRVFLNGEEEPRLKAVDASAPFKTGKIALGGGWSEVEFDYVQVSPLTPRKIHKEAIRLNFQPLENAPVAGWTPVGTDLYSKAKGFGWRDKGLFARKRGRSNDLLYDTLVGFKAEKIESKVFAMDLPDGDYVVSLNMGDPAYRSKNRMFFMDEQNPALNAVSVSGGSSLLQKSVRTYSGQLRIRFEVDEPGVGMSLNWMTVETRAQAGEEVWQKYLLTQKSVDSGEKEALRKMQRAAYEPAQIESPNNSRTEYSLNGKWLFLPDYEVNKAQPPWSPEHNDSAWHIMNVPDFWTPVWNWTYVNDNIARGSANWVELEFARCNALTFDYEKTKVGYYKHYIHLPEQIAGKTIQLHFESIAKSAQIWVNGKAAAVHQGMFAPITVDITPFVKPGENCITVQAGDSASFEVEDDTIQGVAVTVEVTGKMLNSLPHGMFKGLNRGIWQDVSLIISDPVTIEDTFFKPQLNGFNLEVTVTNRSDSPIEYRLAAQIRDHKTKRLVYDHASSSRTTLKTGGRTGAFTVLTNDKSRHAPFKNWSPEIPNLYTAEVFAYRYNSDPSVTLDQFSKNAMKLNLDGLKTGEVLSTKVPDGEYVLTLQFGQASEPSLAEAYIGSNVTDIQQAIVRDFCQPGQFITVLKSLKVENGTLELTVPKLPPPGAKTALNAALLEKRSDVSKAKWNLGLNHFDILDNVAYNAGFRTFAVSGDDLVLNGRPYKMRGANHNPNIIKPNDKELADWFMKTVHDSNINFTRSHANPFNEIWLDAADRHGVAVSQEGIWPWLFLHGEYVPEPELIQIWKREWLALINKHKNHPSLLMWTMNNEMKIWSSHNEQPWRILSDTIQSVRKLDPTRPVVADSGNCRKYVEKKGGQFAGVDDGDIDDHHYYPNWYDSNTFFGIRDGVSFIEDRTPGRPFISQEFSTGYPDADTGHPVKHYIYSHMNPQTLVGKWAYEHQNPEYWLKRHTLISKESCEAIRTGYRETSAGIQIFSLVTWFQNHYDVNTIKPWPTLAAVAQAWEPVMVSAQLMGRHFYAGSSHTINAVVVNDSPTCETLKNIIVNWDIVCDGKVLQSGTKNYSGSLEYYKNKSEKLTFSLPTSLPAPKTEAALVFKLSANGRFISSNSYDILICDPSYIPESDLKVGYFTQEDTLSPILSKLGVNPVAVNDLNTLNPKTQDVLLVDNLTTKPDGYENILKYAEAGGQVLLSMNRDLVLELFPDELRGTTRESREIVTPCAYEKSIFDGIEPDELAWFTGTENTDDSINVGFTPVACERAYNVNYAAHVTLLAETMRIHGYVEKAVEKGYHPHFTFDQVFGYPLIEIKKGKGRIIISSMIFKTPDDPVAHRLLSNVLKYLGNP